MAALALLLTSCFEDKGEVIAEIEGGAVLYKRDLDAVIPKNISKEDSISMAKRYVQSWVTKSLLVSAAENSLSKDQKQVINKELDDYYKSLLIFRYEEAYVHSRLDTAITRQVCEDYYLANKAKFVTPESVIKVKLIKINRSSPNYQIIKSKYKSNREKDLDELETLCVSSAEKYTTYDDQWVSASFLASELETDVKFLEGELKRWDYVEYKKDSYEYLVVVSEKIAPGDITPLEYNMNRIREIILGVRKHRLISDLTTNTYRKALNENKIKIYKNE